ncbi:hypothetical protein [Acinetobacter bouvetii]|uniref:Uncharacterized protein n=1 Tax=Acinetobacter bouvetii TaxID=202951 RepID=A0A811G7U6_9GAMM|nr:hypothetical protein [Acinetobacter bouvetii]CAB1207258.1 hypothetical protein SFB21_0077 [Acinetobacter bouvetii]
MSIQDFAYQLAQRIQTKHAVKISRSHIYELIALNQGYRSYNSFVAQNLLLNCEYDSSEEYYEHELLNLLTLEILKNPPKTDYSNYDDEDIHWDDYESYELLEKIRNLISKLQSLLKNEYLEEQLLNIAKTLQYDFLFLNLNCLNFKELRESLSYIDYENGSVEESEELFDEDINFVSIQKNLEKIHRYAKERNNFDAYAVLAAYYRYLANQIAPYGRDRSTFGSKWDNNKQKYISSNDAKKKIDQYDDFIKFAEYYEEFIKFAPANIEEINLNAGTETVYKQFLYLCNRGDLEAIECFLYNKIFKNSGEAWVYIYLAKLLDMDFTQDDFRAYNAYTGEAYDDYGPMAIAGREAIQYAVHLEQLGDEKDQLARKIAQELFENL